MPLARGLQTIRCRCRVQGGRASTESFSLSGPNPQETTTATPRRNPLAASQPSSQSPPAATVATPECIPTVMIIEGGDACIATRPTKWWGCLLVELLCPAKNIPSLPLSSLSLSRLRPLVAKGGKSRGRSARADVLCVSMKVVMMEINQNSRLNELVRIFRHGENMTSIRMRKCLIFKEVIWQGHIIFNLF